MSNQDSVTISDATTGEIHCESMQFINNIAHDLNNLILIISWSSSRLLSQLSANDANRQLVQDIQDAGAQATVLAHQLYDALRRGPRQSDQNSANRLSENIGAPCDGEKESPACTETILVVEDDPHVRKFLLNTLNSCGYSVLEARHGPAAIATALKHSGPIHLLVTDLVMPEMSGVEVAAALRGDFPRLPTIFLSGLNADAVVQTEMQSGQNGFLQKPFKPMELLLKVRDILDVNSHETSV